MRTSLALVLLLAAGCRTISPRALEAESVRLELGRQVVATLDSQEHYFAAPGTREAFLDRLEGIARATRDAPGYYRQLSEALATLHEGHTGLVGSATIPFSDTIPPVAVLELPEGFVVAGVAPGVESGGLRPGDLILEVEERRAEEVVAQREMQTAGSTPHGRRARAVAHMLAGPTGRPARVKVRDPNGHERYCFPVRFLLDDEGRNRQRFGFLPEELRAQHANAATGYVSLPDFEPGRDEEFFEALRPMLAMPHLILDLRGNPGGRIQVLQRIAAVFFAEPTALLRMAQGGQTEEVKSTSAPIEYRGSVRVIIDARTGSAAELLAAALQDVRGAVVIGRTSAGSTRSRRTARLPGGVLLHYAGQAEFLRLDGRAVEGVGVGPDIAFLPSRTELAAGHFGDAPRDPAVQRALSLN